MRLRPAIFLDRDGTLNRDFGYVHKIADWQWLPGVIAGLRMFKQAGYTLVVVSNQSGIGRGYYNTSQMNALHAWANDRLKAAGCPVSAWYFCPHLPEAACDCRKPLPGMILKAASDLHIDIPASWMLGDKTSDVEAGYKAGCKAALINAEPAEEAACKVKFPQLPVFSDLEAAALYIVKEAPELQE